LFFPRKFIRPFAHKVQSHEKCVKGMGKTGRGFENVRNKLPNATQKSRRVYLKDPRSGK
jgi:hypothetical protein